MKLTPPTRPVDKLTKLLAYAESTTVRPGDVLLLASQAIEFLQEHRAAIHFGLRDAEVRAARKDAPRGTPIVWTDIPGEPCIQRGEIQYLEAGLEWYPGQALDNARREAAHAFQGADIMLRPGNDAPHRVFGTVLCGESWRPEGWTK